MIVTFNDYTPPARADGLPWTHVRIEEATRLGGDFTAIDTQALSPLDPDPSAPISRDFTTDDATVSAGWYRVVFIDAALNESQPSEAEYSGPNLITLADYKQQVGVTGTQDDARIQWAIEAATTAIQSYTGRAFVPDEVAGTRTYLYDCNGFLEIEDASEITAVSVNGSTLDSSSWQAQPYGGPVITWIDMIPLRQQSTALGFTQNLDQPWVQRRLLSIQQEVEVTGNWGWPFVPKDVQQAAIWTVAALLSSPMPYTSESIAGYSRSTMFSINDVSIPDRARRILDLYIRVSL
jgi:hypothetical protein